MAIHNEQQREMGAGHAKRIDEGAMDMMFRMAQEQQYQFPIKSAVRELLSNAVDAVADKKVAIDILTGKAKVEDYFIDKEGAVYKDSHFDASYYDLKWLSDNNEVLMEYVVGTTMGRDKVVVTDYAVGLGPKRLEGYMTLGWSTKRLSKLPIGRFGVGGKSALATGVDYYTVESRYNGMLFRFNVYSRSLDSIIPRFNLETGKENGYILFSEGTLQEYKVYYEGTTEKNGLTISFEVKKHHKQQYIDAVKSQLLYFDNINLYVVQEDGHKELVPHKANIIYEDEHIILSDNQYYSKPHVLLNKVTYGYIQWDELELEEKIGNIGIKVDPSEVDINVSRESLIWAERTKETILSRFGTVVDIATRFINDTLKEPDFWRWIKKCYSISARYSEQGGIIGRLAKIVDLTQVDPVFPGDNRMKFKQDISDILGFETQYVSYVTINQKNQQKKVVDRRIIKNLGAHVNAPIILRDEDERASNRKDKYLLSLYPQGFMLMTEPYSHMQFRTDRERWERMYNEDPEKFVRSMYKDKSEEWLLAKIEFHKKNKSITNAELWELLLKSKDAIAYGTIDIPKDFTGTEEEEILDEEETVEDVKQAEVIRQTAEERRKLEGKIIVNTPRATVPSWNVPYGQVPNFERDKVSGAGVVQTRAYEWQKIEVPIKDINDWDAEEIYYIKEEESEMAHFVAMLTRDTHPDNRIGYGTRRSYAENSAKWFESKWYRINKDKIEPIRYATDAFNCQHFFDAQVMLVKASQANLKYLRDFRPIQEFFIKIKNNKITMSNTLIKWNTARKIKDELSKCAFLYNFEQFNQKYADLYKQLTEYVDKHYREVAEQQGNGFYGLKPETYNDLISHLDNVARFQEYVMSHPEDKEGIGTLAQAMWGNKELVDGMAVDPEMIDNLQEVLDYATGCGTMLNYMPTFTGYADTLKRSAYKPGESRYKDKISEDLELEIKQYLEYKGMLNYGTVFQEDDPGNSFVDTGEEVQGIEEGNGITQAQVEVSA